MRFLRGQVVATPGALKTLEGAGVTPSLLLAWHQSGDWGNVSESDRRANDHAVKSEERILPAYDLPSGGNVWIINEWAGA